MLIGLGDALASMPESQRTAILLREWQGLSYAEIAREMSLTNGAVETLIFRARRTLAKGLEEEPSRRKKIAGGLNVGSLASALKGLLGGAGAAKLAAAGTVAVVATLAAQPLVAPAADAPAPARRRRARRSRRRGTRRGLVGAVPQVQRNMTPPATSLRTRPTRTRDARARRHPSPRARPCARASPRRSSAAAAAARAASTRAPRTPVGAGPVAA